MNLDKIKEGLLRDDGLSRMLEIEYVSTPEPDRCVARMRVGEHNTQPFGFLAGGATLALAENVAGVGSIALCPGQMCVGINVSGNHVKSALDGDVVTAEGHLQHRGRTLHVWHVDVTNQRGELISTVQVTNYVRESK